MRMTSFTLATVIASSILMAAIMYGCLPTVLAWYCCVRNGGQFSWLFGSPKVFRKDGDDL